jgi:hypothetical protein
MRQYASNITEMKRIGKIAYVSRSIMATLAPFEVRERMRMRNISGIRYMIHTYHHQAQEVPRKADFQRRQPERPEISPLK